MRPRVASVVLALALAGPACAATLAPSPIATGGDHPLVRTGHATTVHVRWEAIIHDEGGQFVLWRGVDPDLLGVVAQLNADEGGRYEFVDSYVSAGIRIYQLRYRDGSGKEHILATRQVRIELIGSQQTGALAPTSTSPVVSAEWTAIAAPMGERRFLNELSRVPSDRVHEPPTPPPRRV